MAQLSDDCFAFGGALLTVDAALALIAAQVGPVDGTEGLPLHAADGRVLAVGDALRTDIAGARAAGVDACWVLGGLHGAHGGTAAAVEAEARAAGLAPVAAIPHFVW